MTELLKEVREATTHQTYDLHLLREDWNDIPHSVFVADTSGLSVFKPDTIANTYGIGITRRRYYGILRKYRGVEYTSITYVPHYNTVELEEHRHSAAIKTIQHTLQKVFRIYPYHTIGLICTLNDINDVIDYDCDFWEQGNRSIIYVHNSWQIKSTGRNEINYTSSNNVRKAFFSYKEPTSLFKLNAGGTPVLSDTGIYNLEPLPTVEATLANCIDPVTLYINDDIKNIIKSRMEF